MANYVCMYECKSTNVLDKEKITAVELVCQYCFLSIAFLDFSVKICVLIVKCLLGFEYHY